MPNQKTGTDWPSRASVEAPRSHQVPSRVAASTPSGMPTSRARAMPAPTSCRVNGSRSMIIEVFDW